jgi:CHAD domain-containing protein
MTHPLAERYEDLSEAFYLYFGRISQGLRSEDLHRLRVTIKKLRAIWSLVEWAYDGKWNKKQHIALSSKLFNAAGKVREGELNRALVDKYNVKYLLPYKDHIMAIQNRSIMKLHIRIQDFELNKFKDNTQEIYPLLNALSKQQIIRLSLAYVLKETRKVHELIEDLPEDNKLHKIRIHLKVTSEILGIIIRVNASIGLRSFLNNIKSLNDRIGLWHDYVVLHRSLSKFTEKDPIKNHDKRLSALMVRIENQQAMRRHKIEKSIQKHITEQRLVQIENLL